MEGADSAIAGPSTVAFDDVVVDLDRFELRRAGEEVSVEPQVFDVLRYLIEHRDRVVSKIELFDNVWGDRFVSESALTSRIKSARQAVGDDGRAQRVIRTTHGRGYRFVAELTMVDRQGGDRQQPDAVGATPGGVTVIPDGVPPAANEPALAAPHRSSVPAPARPLIERDDELARLLELLDSNRLVTIVGPGGVGKTRLATEAALRWDDQVDEPVIFIPLAPVPGPDEVFATVRGALGIGSGGAVDALAAVQEALAGRSAMLILDNFEHVVEAATEVAELIGTVPGVRALVTSRERLGLAGEQVMELGPLPLAADTPTGGPAAVFFEHEVRRVRSGVDLDPAYREDIKAICRTLDGLPLAIDDLLAVVDKSLVQRSDGSGGEPRFSMLRLVRDFARAELEASGARGEILDRHANFVSETMQEFERRRWGDSGDGWIDAISAEFADVSAALDWCFNGDGDPTVGCEIVSALSFWWYRSGRIGEGRLWTDHALDNASVADETTMAWVHSAAGTVAAFELRRDDSRYHFQTALDLARKIGDDRLEAFSLCDYGASLTHGSDEIATGIEMALMAELGVDNYERLVRDGRSMSLEDGIDLAAEELASVR